MKTSNTNNHPQIACPKCEGTGKVPLGAELFQALNALRKLGKATAPELRAALDPKGNYNTVTAFNGQLNALVEHGLATRSKVVKTWVYEPA